MNPSQSNNIKDNVRNAADKVLGTNATEQAGDKLESLYGTAKESLSTAGHKLTEGYNAASVEIRKAGTQFEAAVKKNPLLAVAMAAGLGWVVGRFVSAKMASSERA